MMDGVGSVEEVFFSKVSGKIISEIFEKSIDKHKIDAILNAPSFRSGPLRGCFDGRASGRRIPRKNPVLPSRYKDSDEEWPGSFLRSGAGSGNG